MITVEELIKKLEVFPPKAKVMCYSSCYDTMSEITGDLEEAGFIMGNTVESRILIPIV